MPKRKIMKDQHFSVSVCPARTGARVLQYSTNFIEILKKNHELSAFLRGCCYTIPASSGVYLRSPNSNRPINILWPWRGKILHATIRRMHLTTLGHTHPTILVLIRCSKFCHVFPLHDHIWTVGSCINYSRTRINYSWTRISYSWTNFPHQTHTHNLPFTPMSVVRYIYLPTTPSQNPRNPSIQLRPQNEK